MKFQDSSKALFCGSLRSRENNVILHGGMQSSMYPPNKRFLICHEEDPSIELCESSGALRRDSNLALYVVLAVSHIHAGSSNQDKNAHWTGSLCRNMTGSSAVTTHEVSVCARKYFITIFIVI